MKSGASVIGKLTGKAFGACATANVACRNGLLRLVVGSEAPLDATVRLLDALAAVAKTQLFAANHFEMETKNIWSMKIMKAKELAPVSLEKAPSHLSSEDLASRRV